MLTFTFIYILQSESNIRSNSNDVVIEREVLQLFSNVSTLNILTFSLSLLRTAG